MAWFKVDDGLVDHRKVRRLGRDKAAAMGVWVLCGAWSAANLTDGFVPVEIVQRFDAREVQARKLVDAGLWAEAEHDGEPGYLFHDWADVQPTRADVEARRAETRKRVAKHRGGRPADEPPPDDDGGGGNAPRNGTRNGTGNALHDEGVTAPRVQAGAGTRVAPATRVPGPARPDPARPTSGAQPDTGGRNPRNARIGELAASAHSVGAHRLVEGYAATCNRRPPTKILSQLGIEVDALLVDGWPEHDIDRALTAWGTKTLGPGALQAVAHEVVNRRPAAAAARSTTDDRVAAAQALKTQLRALPGGA